MQLVEIKYLAEYLPNKSNLAYIESKVNKSGIADINILLNQDCGSAGTHGWAFKGAGAGSGGVCIPELNVIQVCHKGTKDPYAVAVVAVHEIGHTLGKNFKRI